MRDSYRDWLTISAAGLVAGSMALWCAVALSPRTQSGEGILMAVQDQQGHWLMGAVGFFFASAGLTLGVPAILAAAPHRGRRWMHTGAALLSVGFVGLAGFAFLLLAMRALVDIDAVTAEELTRFSEDGPVSVLMGVWLAALYLGEVCVAVGCVLAGPERVPRWIPAVMILHVAGLAGLGGPEWVPPVVTGLFALGFSGLGIRVIVEPAVQPAVAVGRASVRVMGAHRGTRTPTP